MSKVTVAVGQMACYNDMEAAYAKAEEMIAEAAQKGARLIVLPEMMNYVGKPNPDSFEFVPQGICCTRMAAAAKKHNIWVNLGSIHELDPEDPEGKPYNTSVIFSPEGVMAGKYRKLHLSDMQASPEKPISRESDRIKAGDRIVTVDTEFARVGMSICYDLRFPEMFRLMSEAGAKIVCLPACFNSTTGAAHWEVLLRSIAVLNHCYVLASNHCGKKYNGNGVWGHSMIIDPWGTPVALAGQEREALLLAEIDLDYCEELRGRLGCMTNRRPDIYRLEMR
jgi:predicted amidohydrolase